MRYEFKCQTSALDVWKLSMYQTYRSPVGMVNLVFTVALILLTAKFWNQVPDALQLLLLFGCLLFPVVQPVGVYVRAKKQVNSVEQGTELVFDDRGVHVSTSEERADIKWKNIRRIVKEPHMLIVFTDGVHGYMLTNKVLGAEREEFYAYAAAQIGQEQA
jgi:hypothetical protein